MKISLNELRNMVATAVRRTVSEAKKKKELPQQSEESIEARKERMTRGLPGHSAGPGYMQGGNLDFSKPLGKKNLLKRQGASGMGNWTSEAISPTRPGAMGSSGGQHLVTLLLKNGVPKDQAMKIAKDLEASGWKQSGINDPGAVGLSDPKGLGIEQKNEAIRALVRLIVNEEIQAVKRR